MKTRLRPESGTSWPVVVGATLAGLAVVWLLTAIPTLSKTENWSGDFLAYRDAAVRLAEEGTLYLSSSLEGPFVPMFESYYLYPPPFGLAISPIARLSASDGEVAWYLIHVAVLVLACALMPVRPVIRLWCVAIAAVNLPILSDLIHGNVSSILLLPLVLGWRWLDRPMGSIAIAIAASVRVALGAFLLWFLVRRAWRPLLWTLVGSGALVLMTLPFIGLDGYRDYLVMMGNLRVPTDLEQNRHVLAAASALGAPDELAWAALILTWLVAIVAIVASRWRDPEVGFMVAVAASMLLAPTMWGHYISLLILPAAFLAHRGRPWALGLPLLAWLPEVLTPLWAIMALVLPFMARDAIPSAGTQPSRSDTGEAPGAGPATPSVGPA